MKGDKLREVWRTAGVTWCRTFTSSAHASSRSDDPDGCRRTATFANAVSSFLVWACSRTSIHISGVIPFSVKLLWLLVGRLAPSCGMLVSRPARDAHHSVFVKLWPMLPSPRLQEVKPIGATATVTPPPLAGQDDSCVGVDTVSTERLEAMSWCWDLWSDTLQRQGRRLTHLAVALIVDGGDLEVVLIGREWPLVGCL